MSVIASLNSRVEKLVSDQLAGLWLVDFIVWMVYLVDADPKYQHRLIC